MCLPRFVLVLFSMFLFLRLGGTSVCVTEFDLEVLSFVADFIYFLIRSCLSWDTGHRCCCLSPDGWMDRGPRFSFFLDWTAKLLVQIVGLCWDQQCIGLALAGVPLFDCAGVQSRVANG
jgi:hypothetical protein